MVIWDRYDQTLTPAHRLFIIVYSIQKGAYL